MRNKTTNEYFAICDECEQAKLVREFKGIDPRRANAVSLLCKQCSSTIKDYKNTLKKLSKLPETHCAFGALEEMKNVKHVQMHSLDYENNTVSITIIKKDEQKEIVHFKVC